MINKTKPKPHIVVSQEVKDELDKLSENKSDTYEDIIKRLLKVKQEKKVK